MVIKQIELNKLNFAQELHSVHRINLYFVSFVGISHA